PPFLFTAPPTSDLHTLSLHDALPIWLTPAVRHQLQQLVRAGGGEGRVVDVQVEFDQLHVGRDPVSHALEQRRVRFRPPERFALQDRKSTRLNSSHGSISYAVFCLKKK